MADRKLDEYQPKRFYTQNTKARENGFAKFEKDGAFYFALYQDGDIVMLSQSYKGVAGRDNGIESVRKNRRITKRYRFDRRKGGKHGFGLYAGNGQEIAISANLTSRAEAERVAGRLNGSVKTKRKAAPKKAAPKKKVAAKAAPKKRAKNDEDNYRRLAFYEKHTKGRKNGIESFKGDDGNYYFAHFENGKIRLISESYPTTTARDTGAASVQKNIKLEKRYEYRGPFKNGKYDYRLKAGNGKEIARSVWYGSSAAAATGAAYLMGKRKRTKPKPRTVKPAPKPVVKTVAPKVVKPTPPPIAKVAAPVAAAAASIPKAPVAAAAAPAVAAATGGGLGFLRWLLPLLLALLAAFFLFKYCKPAPKAPIVAPLVSCWDGTEAENQNACPTKVTCWDGSNVANASACPAEPPKMVTCWDGSEVKDLSSCPAESAPEPVVEPEPTPDPVTTFAEPVNANISRICGPSTNVLFDVPNYSPKTVTYLGSNPQYGNSHGLTPAQFHAKLAAAHRSGGMDQAFLNLMARSLGYSHFQDMSAADFSEETLANGSKGLLGFSTSHVLQYSKIQTTDTSNLEAFRVRSLNGTDVHIMKTCGNYMYVCN